VRRVESEIRVRYQETDRMGFAHHSAFFAWFEVGRSDLIRHAGISYARIEEEKGILLPVVEAVARFRSPARYEDVLRLETWAADLGRAQVTFQYRLFQAEGGEVVATGSTRHAVLDGGRRPHRLPGWLRSLLEDGEEG